MADIKEATSAKIKDNNSLLRLKVPQFPMNFRAIFANLNRLLIKWLLFEVPACQVLKRFLYTIHTLLNLILFSSTRMLQRVFKRIHEDFFRLEFVLKI